MQKKRLHQVQERLLKLLIDNIDEPLTVRELQERLDLSSTSGVAHHMKQLEKKGHLKRNPYNPKDYQVLSDSPEKAVAYLNLYGLAFCGPNGSILDGDPIDRIPISSRLISFPVTEAFMVKAKGKSMEPKISDGDLVIARKIHVPEDGKIYVCVNDGEALIKRIRFDSSNKKNKILQSLNPQNPPFIASNNLRIEGEVKAIISRKI